MPNSAGAGIKEPLTEWVSGDSGLNETLFDKLADLVESFSRPKASKRVAVAVSKDVFSRVSHLAFSRELDKIDILTFLFHRHLGDLKADKIPKWLLVESKGPNRVDYLSFLETPDLAKKDRATPGEDGNQQGGYCGEARSAVVAPRSVHGPGETEKKGDPVRGRKLPISILMKKRSASFLMRRSLILGELSKVEGLTHG